MKLTYLFKKKLFYQAFGFLLAGIIANIISLSVYIISFKSLNIALIYSSIFGQLFGLSFSYFLNSRFVFKRKIKLNLKISFFLYYFLSIYLAGFYVQYFSNKGLNYILSWFICTLIAASSNFLFNKFIIFKN